MTKDEVLQGALALNGTDKKYTVSIEDDSIIVQANYAANAGHTRNAVFRCVAHLNDDNTYVETHSDSNPSGLRRRFGTDVLVQKSISFTFGGGSDTVEVEKASFHSEDIKKILRDYLASCGYTRTYKGFFKKLFGR